jgi:hypothetical protein
MNHPTSHAEPSTEWPAVLLDNHDSHISTVAPDYSIYCDGLVVSMLTSGTQDHGFDPGRSRLSHVCDLLGSRNWLAISRP